jgi:hypothetical protein
MLKVRVVYETLSDGSKVYNVLLSNDDGDTLELHATGYGEANHFATQFARLTHEYTCELADVVDLAGAE